MTTSGLAAILLAAALAAPAFAEGPAASELPAAPSAPSAASCARLTPEALSGAEAVLTSVVGSTEAALAEHGTGNYPGAMKRALDYFAASRDKMSTLGAFLREQSLLSPHVSNASAAYNVAGYAREALGSLDLGRHWASVATAYDRSAAGKAILAEAAKAHDSIAVLESDGLTCYVSAYVP